MLTLLTSYHNWMDRSSFHERLQRYEYWKTFSSFQFENGEFLRKDTQEYNDIMYYIENRREILKNPNLTKWQKFKNTVKKSVSKRSKKSKSGTQKTTKRSKIDN